MGRVSLAGRGCGATGLLGFWTFCAPFLSLKFYLMDIETFLGAHVRARSDLEKWEVCYKVWALVLSLTQEEKEALEWLVPENFVMEEHQGVWAVDLELQKPIKRKQNSFYKPPACFLNETVD